ncbi:4-hydroxybenzoate octaprenyltransferase [Rhodobacteraceae bacterium WD3A24]|nr:4-hydroxybenzoate octaprenyltransferase [Rhodobacteraceae bacterium WD3A24]
MGLIAVQRNRLPRPQRVLYIQPDSRHCFPSRVASESPDPMTDPHRTPEHDPTGRIADATQGNWVDTIAPPEARPYLRLSRIDRPIGTWLLLLPCWWGALLGAAHDPSQAGWKTVWIFVACGIGAILMRGAGCTWNDLTDRDIDTHVERTRARPIPSGAVTPQQAVIWLGAQAGVAFLVLLTFNSAAIALGLAALILVAVYPFAKRFTWWPQIFLGLAFNWGALLAWTAQTGSLGLPAVFLYLSGIAWTIFYDTIYAHQDKEDDALIGVKSTALLFAGDTQQWLRGFLVAAVVLMSLAIIYALAELANPLKMALALGGAWAFGWHLVWQLGRLDIDDPDRCLQLFRANRDAGLLPALFIAIALFA